MRAAKLNGATRNGRAAVPNARVAIYARQSVDRGDEYGSTDAQREAIEAYVASQRHKGWAVLPEAYVDGGFSGASLDRPAFQRLLRDIENGLVDVVAVYKIDRLSRSLLDFTKLTELFEASGVALVSVTESFETTSPMGRMVLNMLATFAQFERETIAQRTRDKIVASRRKGMWTGGRPVLGFDVVDKKLVVNAEEAERVRAIFDLYMESDGLVGAVEELARRGWKTKTWTNKNGTLVRGTPFNKGSLHALLTNPLYLGKTRCGDELHDGAHDAIVDPGLFQAVRSKLKKHRGGRAPRNRPNKHGALLVGLAKCVCGASLVHSYSKKNGRLYRYYVCRKMQEHGAKACPGSRVSVGDLEGFVFDEIRRLGTDPRVLDAVIEADQKDRDARRPELEAEARRVASEHGRLSRERKNLVDAVAKGNGSASGALMTRIADLDEQLASLDQRAYETRSEIAALDLDAPSADELRVALLDLEPVWDELFPRERARILALLLKRVEFDGVSGEVAIEFREGAPRGIAEVTR